MYRPLHTKKKSQKHKKIKLFNKMTTIYDAKSSWRRCWIRKPNECRVRTDEKQNQPTNWTSSSKSSNE